MKARPTADWFRWSDGRKFSKKDWRKFRYVLDKQKRAGESFRQRFERVRAIVEKYEETQKKILVTKPGIIARAISWLRCRPGSVRMEVKP